MNLAQEYKLYTWRFTLCCRIVCIQNSEIRMYANQIVNANGNEQNNKKTKHRKLESKEKKRKSNNVQKKWIELLFLTYSFNLLLFFFIEVMCLTENDGWMVLYEMCVCVMTELHWIAITTCNFGGYDISYMFYNILNANLSCGFRIGATICKLCKHVRLPSN